MPHYERDGSHCEADELTGLEEHERDEYHPGSDYEYCRFHPTEVISNGMFDAPCGGCEASMDPEPEVPTDEELALHAQWERDRAKAKAEALALLGDIPF